MKIANDIIDTPFSEALSERYLAYALSTIVSRSLPDVRDGLKPVHRRLLYAMQEMRLSSKTLPKKSARVVGDVMGKYHPHGDQAIYDALVRLSQDFAERYPLIDGQGNFGNIDGDNAAAMRYTEARLTEVAEALLEGMAEDAIDFRPTYDEEGKEPVVLPAAFPNLLANGAMGIAVGMATSIPPHNVGEIAKALIYLLENPDASVKQLMRFIKGPDFPTGGELVESKEAMIAAYESGRGSFRVRAKWQKEELPQGQWQLVVTEIPYQIQKSRLIERIAELMGAKKLPMLDDILDESSEDIRIVLIPKSRNVKPEHLIESLFKYTDLESKFSLNMNVLTEGKVPKVLPLNHVLQAFLDHRFEVLTRRSKHRLAQIAHRLEVVEGYLAIFINLDRVIEIIRFEDHPKIKLQEEFKLTEVQIEAILNMRLRALHKLQEIALKEEHKALTDEKTSLEALLASKEIQTAKIIEEIKLMDERFGLRTALGRRRTLIGDAPKVIHVPDEVFIEKKPITVTCSKKGWVRAFQGHQIDKKDIRYKEGDAEQFILKAETTDKLLFFTQDGKIFTLNADKLPKGRGFGEPLNMILDISAPILSVFIYDEGGEIIVVSNKSRGFRVPMKAVIAQTKNGKQILNLAAGEKALLAIKVEGDHLASIGNNRKLLIFPLDELPLMNRGKGVLIQRFKDGRINDLKSFNASEGLSWNYGEGRVRRVEDIKPWVGKRASAGKMPPNGFPRNNKF